MKKIRHPLAFFTVLLATVAVFCAVACSGATLAPKGELMLVVTSDMAPPKDFDLLHIEVSRAGNVLHSADYDIATGPVPYKLPATLGIVAGSNPNEPVDIRVLARQGGAGGKARVLRDARTLVPADRIAMLPITIQWLCDNSAVEQGGQVTSTCGDGATCIAGACRPVTDGTDSLPDYDPTSIFGGDQTPACFDTLGCFAAGQIVPVDAATCTIAKPPPGAGINVALVGPAGSTGICSTQACLVPLDRSDVTGLVPGTPLGYATVLA